MKEITIEIKHFNNAKEKRIADQYCKSAGLKKFNSLSFQFKRIPEGTYNLYLSYIFDNQYNTIGKDGHKGYRIFEYCERLVWPNCREDNIGYYISKGIEDIREYQKTVKTCGFCGKQYHNTKIKWCNSCLGSKYLEKDNLPLLLLTTVGEKRKKVKIPKGLIQKVEAKQRIARKKALKQDIKNKKNYLKKKVQSAKKEQKGFLWIINNNINYDNCIYYNHTDVFYFGWRNSLDENEKADLHIKLRSFPFNYELK